MVDDKESSGTDKSAQTGHCKVRVVPFPYSTVQTANPAANVSKFPEHAGKLGYHVARSSSRCFDGMQR